MITPRIRSPEEMWIIRNVKDHFLEGEWYRSPTTYHMKKDRRAQMIYFQWAVREIIMDMEHRPYWSPLDCVSVFKSRMNDYACRNINTSYIFSVAHDAAEEIEDFIVCLMHYDDSMCR